MLVACMDPRDFYGLNLVQELRKRTEANAYTNPFQILVLCNAGDTMTSRDVAGVMLPTIHSTDLSGQKLRRWPVWHSLACPQNSTS
ncbi:gastric intrinsic factor [Trichonephila clavata]|uniref:Gastric intrinsic factor n=1 Tax=Trichonephila clavata TaxID=2740835 RepID=A0A8X6HY21_TRICU|nr:gastric intrinsic factor [Trichonephila clavata]